MSEERRLVRRMEWKPLPVLDPIQELRERSKALQVVYEADRAKWTKDHPLNEVKT